MAADLTLLRADVRARWRGLLLLTLLIAVVVAAVLATLAGARRTETAFDRYLAEVRPMDAVTTTWDPTQELSGLEQIPGIEAAVDFHWYSVFPGDLTRQFIPLVVPDDDRIPVDYMRYPLLEGRRPDPAEPLEVALGERTARRLGVGLGDSMRTAAYTDEEMALGFDADIPDAADHLDFEVVGIVRGPGDIASRENDIEISLLTPAFAEEYGESVGLFTVGALVRLEHDASLEEVSTLVQEQYPDLGVDLDAFVGTEVVTAQAEPTLRSMATGLRILALAVVLVGGASILLALQRRAIDPLAEQHALSALGLDRAGLLRHVGLASAISAVIGVVLGTGGSILVSPLTSWGLAERADPAGSLTVDGLVLGLGAAVALTVLLAAVGAVSTLALRRERRARADAGRPSALASRAAAAGAPLAVVAGLRLAFERGRGTRSIPVATAAAAATLGGLGVVAALVFSSSLQHAVESPAIWGYEFDAILNRDVDGPGMERENDQVIPEVVADPSFTTVAEYVVDLDLAVEGMPESAVVLEDLQGHTPFVIARGREPLGAGEVAVGGTMLANRGLAIGDAIDLSRGERSVEARVVGVAVLPVTDDGGLSSTGLAMRRDTADALGFDGTCSEDEDCIRGLALGLAPGIDPEIATAPYTSDQTLLYVPPAAPSEVERLTVVDGLPRLLALFLALISIVTLAHAASATVRRRRRDLAVLRVLGLTGRDLRSIVRVQVAALTLLGGTLGVVLGVAVGRQLWSGVARSISLPVVAEMPIAAVIVVPLAILVLALAAATSSRRAAGRISTGLVLRTE